MIDFDIRWLFPRFMLNDREGFAVCRAIEAGLKAFLDICQSGIDTWGTASEMPEWRLDEMAWEYNIPYDYTASVEQKREWVRDAVPLYRTLGTKKGIYQFLKGYFGEIEIQENWEYGGDPYHFRVTVGGEWTPSTEAWARKAIDRVKSLRSVLDDLRPGCQVLFTINATAGIKERFRYPCAGELWAGEYPTENVIWRIDETPQAAINAADQEGRVAYRMAGTYPEINHTLALDNTPMRGDEAEEIVHTIYYPLCGEDICGQ